MAVITGFEVGLGEPLVELWNRSLPGDPITVDRFRNLVLLDANFDPDGLRIVRDGDEVVAAAYAVRRRVAMVADDLEPERGWLPFFFVDPRRRRTGLGRRLLRDAMDWLRARGCGEVHFSPYTPNYILPGLDRRRYPEAAALLEDLGFRTLYQASAMALPLTDHVVPDKVGDNLAGLRAAGYSFGSPRDDELVPLLRLACELNPDWARAIRDAARSGLPLDRIVVARAPGGGVIGWGMCGAYEGVVDRFGPFAVVSERRGLGIGEALLHLSLKRMRALGAHSAWFLWSGEQTPAGHLYRKTGFTTTRVFDVMRAWLQPQEEGS
ncbi:MAG: GNAT family N-acetyltransferase [Stackebrandtia sp.]